MAAAAHEVKLKRAVQAESSTASEGSEGEKDSDDALGLKAAVRKLPLDFTKLPPGVIDMLIELALHDGTALGRMTKWLYPGCDKLGKEIKQLRDRQTIIFIGQACKCNVMDVDAMYQSGGAAAETKSAETRVTAEAEKIQVRPTLCPQ